MQGKLWGNEYRTTLICIDTFERSVPAGRMYNPAIPEGESFYGVLDLLRKVELLLDEMKFPQPFNARRNFQPPVERAVSGPVSALAQRGSLATFAVRVIFRQNSSWQGAITWQEQNRENSFRSVLELLQLMDSALGLKEDAQEEGEAPEEAPKGGE